MPCAQKNSFASPVCPIAISIFLGPNPLTIPDHRKFKSNLLTGWPSIPVEVAPIAARSVQAHLRALGSTDPKLREGHVPKAGPLKTDQDFFIIDAPFPPLIHRQNVVAGKATDPKAGVWRVEELSAAIRLIEGVLEVGIFSGPTGPEAAILGMKGGQRPVACYFGMEDGSVTVRRAIDTVRRAIPPTSLGS